MYQGKNNLLFTNFITETNYNELAPRDHLSFDTPGNGKLGHPLDAPLRRGTV